MAKAVILVVDDEPEVLNAIDRDLRHHFTANYRVMKASSGAEALEATRQLRKRGTPIALFLVDERMPGMTGTQFLMDAIKLSPDSRRVLLTAYADTQTAIDGINSVGLDYYLLKPWEPPEERLYPPLDDLLLDWRANVRPTSVDLRVAGTASSSTSYQVKDFLARNQVPYQWIDLDADASMRAVIASMPDGTSRLPVVLFADGTTMVQPSPRALADKIGLQTRPTSVFYDLVVIGGGPAGLAAALYGASEGLMTALVESNAPGGQAGTSSRIENYLGFPNGVTGADLARRATIQAKRFGAQILTAQNVVEIRRHDPYRIAILADGTELPTHAVVVASGMEVRRLDAPGVAELTGAGVYYGTALSEAATYRNKRVYIIGGANSAGQGAMFLSRYAQQVTMVVRGADLSASMSRYLIERIRETSNVRVLTRSAVASVGGTDRLETITVINSDTGATETMAADAMFIFIGTAPHTEIVAGLVERDAQGFILTGRDLLVDGKWPRAWTPDPFREPFLFETSVPGIFAAGDARHGSGKRVASAVGEGSAAVSMIHRYLDLV